MTKEEKIKEAWGLNYDEFSEYIDSDGWARYPHFQKHEMVQDVRPIEFRSQGTDFRPKSLQGIENNNGWIKIESEDDLPTPKLVNECYFISLEKNTDVSEIIRGFTDKTGKFFICSESYRTIFYNDTFYKITHYQPIEKPKPPIY